MNQISAISGVIKSAAGLLALFPVVLVIYNLVQVPPSLSNLVKAISFSIGILLIIAIPLLSAKVRGVDRGRFVVLAIVAVIAGSSLAYAYWNFAANHVIVVENTDPSSQAAPTEALIIPVNPSSRITALVEPYGGDYLEAVQNSVQRAALKAAIIEESWSSIAIMIFLLVAAQILLVAPVVWLAWMLASDISSRKKQETEPARQA